MTSTSQTEDSPVRYSNSILLLVTFCLLLAQHYLPSAIHKGLDSNDLVAQAGGNAARQIAYLIIGLLGILGVANAHRLKRTSWFENYRIVITIGLLLGWCLLSLLWSDMFAVATKRLVVVGLMFLGSFGLALSWDSIEIIKFIVLSSAIDVSVGLAGEIVSGYFTPMSGDYRFSGTLTPNEQGYLCMVLAISAICLGRIVSSSGRKSWQCNLLAIYGILLLLLTRSRGALVALGIAVVLYFLFVTQSRKRFLIALLAGTFCVTLLISGNAEKLMDTLQRGGEGSENFTGRAPLWDELMDYVHDRPWLGRGYESFWNAQTMDDVFRHQHWPVESAHSEYIECMLTIGIIGMIFHTIALLVGMIEGLRLYMKNRNLVFFLGATLCCIYLAGGFLEAILIVKPSPISFYLAILLCSMMICGRTEVQQPLQRYQTRRGNRTPGKQLARISQLGPR